MPPIANSVKAPKAMFLPEVTVYCLLHGFFDFRYTYVYSLVVGLRAILLEFESAVSAPLPEDELDVLQVRLVY